MRRLYRARIAGLAFGLALTWCGAGVGLADAGRTADPHDPAVIPDSGGRITEVVIHYDADFAEDLVPLFDSLFAAMPADISCLVVCPTAESAADFEARWGAAECERGRVLRVENVDRPITLWSRDRRIARWDPASGMPAAMLAPREWSTYEDDKRNDLLVNYLLEQRGVVPEVVDTFLHIEGGNLVSNDRHAFLGANVFEDNENLGYPRAAVSRELIRVLGRAPVIIGQETGRVPWEHVDMYVTPIDEHTLLVGSPTVALMLLYGDPSVELKVDGEPSAHVKLYDLVCGHDTFDEAADQLGLYDYEILRMPALVNGTEWMISYNNVIMEQRGGRRVVYMPVYDMPRLDQAAEAVYRGLGFEVHRIDVSRVYRWGGALRCLVNVLGREPRDANARGATPLPPPVAAAPVSADDAQGALAPEREVPRAPAAPLSAVVVDSDEPAPALPAGLPPTWLVWLPLFIFVARVVDVSLGVFRLICITRGQRVLATILAALEVTVWILAVASVLTHLNNWVNILAYTAGFTVGNVVGLWIDRQVGLGMQTVMLISRERGGELATGLRAANLQVTTLSGAGRDGAVDMCLLVVGRRQTPTVLNLATSIDPDVLVTVEDVQHTSIKCTNAALLAKAPRVAAQAPWWTRRRGGQRVVQ